MSEIYLIRHAQGSFASKNYDRLSEIGYQQSRVLGDYFAHMGVRFDSVYSGTLERQKETAITMMSRMKENGADPPLSITPEFNEYSSDSIMKKLLPVILEEKPTAAQYFETMFTDRRAFQRMYMEAMLRWLSGKYDQPEVETFAQFTQRVRAGALKVMGENGRGKTVALVTSGGPISAFMQMALGITAETALNLSLQLRNASVSTLKYNDKQEIALSSFNSTAHLEITGQTELLTYR